jgi:hypothetical protein
MTGLYPPNLSSHGREEHFWTFAAVEERLIEAVRLWRRSPGEGRWPFAGDAPWQLMTRKTRVAIGIEGGLKGRELQLHMQAEDAEEAKRWEGRERSGPLSRDDVARRDEASEWLRHVGEQDRRLVVLVLVKRAAGVQRIDWSRIREQIGAGIENKGLYRRYSRAITAVVKELNRAAASA